MIIISNPKLVPFRPDATVWSTILDEADIRALHLASLFFSFSGLYNHKTGREGYVRSVNNVLKGQWPAYAVETLTGAPEFLHSYKMIQSTE